MTEEKLAELAAKFQNPHLQIGWLRSQCERTRGTMKAVLSSLGTSARFAGAREQLRVQIAALDDTIATYTRADALAGAA